MFAKAFLELQVVTLRDELAAARQSLEGALHELAECRLAAGRAEGLVDGLALRVTDKDGVIEALRAEVKDLHRDATKTTGDILLSMGIGVSQDGPPNLVSSELKQAARVEDRQDDENVGLSPTALQDEQQRAEWEAYNKEQQEEMNAFLERRKAEIAQQNKALKG